MSTRRFFIQAIAAITALPLAACDSEEASAAPVGVGGSKTTYRMPEEAEPHRATWMAYGATAEAWGTTGVYGASRAIARLDLMRIAANLSRFEPVKMLVNSSADLKQAQANLEKIRLEKVNLNPAVYQPNSVFTGGEAVPTIEAAGKIEFILQPLNDLWVRDTAPVFVKDNQQQVAAVNLNFNGWGQESTGAAGWRKDPNKAANGIEDQRVTEDRKIADFIIQRSQVKKLSTWLVMEGGGIEVDGEGTAICTESCILNPNRNPNRSKAEVEVELNRLFGVTKVIWLKGVKAKDITDGHVDFYARFVGEATVVYTLDNDPESSDYAATQEHKRILENATDAKGRKLNAIALVSPDFEVLQPVVEARNWPDAEPQFNEDAFAAGYVGFYVANECVLMAQFGDAAADMAAFELIQELYPDRMVLQMTTDGLANGGGTIHCATQQQIV
jgi:agmatine deiminase